MEGNERIPQAGGDSHSGEPTLNEALLVGTNRILEMIVRGEATQAAILDAIARLAEELCPRTLCTILLLDGDILRHGAAPSMPEEYIRAVDGLRIGPRAGSCGAAAFLRKPIVTRDIETDPLWEDYRHLALRHGLRTCWSTPVLDREGNTLATFAIYYREAHDPTWFEQRVLDAGIHLAKMAIEHIQATRKREESEQRFRVLVETTTDSIWVANAEGMLLAEPEMTWGKLTGQTDRELANRGWLEAVNRDDRDRVWTRWKESFETLRPFEQEYRIRKTDGTLATVVDRGSPIHNPDGTVREWIGAVTDVTSRKRSEERLRFLVDVGAMFGASTDYEQTLESLANCAVHRIADYCAITLEAQGTTARKTLSAAHPSTPSDEQEKRTNLECVALALRKIDSPLLIPRVSEPSRALPLPKDDADRLERLRILSFAAAPILARDENIGLLVLATDRESGHLFDDGDLALIEELSRRIVIAMDRTRTFRELQTAIQARDEFLSVASHELKTPLTPLQLQIQAIDRRPQGEIPAWLVPKLRVIRNQIERFARLVDQLLDISRIAEGRVQLELSQVDLGEVIEDVVARAKSIGEVAPAGSTISLQGERGVIGSWDRLRLEQVVSNLLNNALKYGERKPITIAWSADADMATLRVRDLGIGIAPEDQARIFTRFERAVSLRHYGGFGLGLFIVRRIVEAMGGGVSVTSALGQGSTFTVELPLEPTSRESDRAP